MKMSDGKDLKEIKETGFDNDMLGLLYNLEDWDKGLNLDAVSKKFIEPVFYKR